MMSSEMLNPRHEFGATAIDNKILVAGGYTSQGTYCETEVFCPKTNTWTASKKMPDKRCGFAMATVKGLPNREDYLTHRR